MTAFSDGEIMGIDGDGRLRQWDDAMKQVYNCGETIEEFGAANISVVEWARLPESVQHLRPCA